MEGKSRLHSRSSTSKLNAQHSKINAQRASPTMILAGDIGGTKTLLGLFDSAPARPRPTLVRSFGTLDYDDLETMIATFLKDGHAMPPGIETACFGAAGPVIDEAVQLTNVPWRVDARRVKSTLGFGRVALLNDLEAMAYAVDRKSTRLNSSHQIISYAVFC